MMTNRIELSIERATRGEPGWEVSAWRGIQYLGSCRYLFATKQEALASARETIRQEGGLGIYRKSLA